MYFQHPIIFMNFPGFGTGVAVSRPLYGHPPRLPPNHRSQNAIKNQLHGQCIRNLLTLHGASGTYHFSSTNRVWSFVVISFFLNRSPFISEVAKSVLISCWIPWLKIMSLNEDGNSKNARHLRDFQFHCTLSDMSEFSGVHGCCRTVFACWTWIIMNLR